jgi:hypothetical protein
LREQIKLAVILTAVSKSTACGAVLLRQVDVGTVEKSSVCKNYGFTYTL